MNANKTPIKALIKGKEKKKKERERNRNRNITDNNGI